MLVIFLDFWLWCILQGQIATKWLKTDQKCAQITCLCLSLKFIIWQTVA